MGKRACSSNLRQLYGIMGFPVILIRSQSPSLAFLICCPIIYYGIYNSILQNNPLLDKYKTRKTAQMRQSICFPHQICSQLKEAACIHTYIHTCCPPCLLREQAGMGPHLLESAVLVPARVQVECTRYGSSLRQHPFLEKPAKKQNRGRARTSKTRSPSETVMGSSDALCGSRLSMKQKSGCFLQWLISHFLNSCFRKAHLSAG